MTASRRTPADSQEQARLAELASALTGSGVDDTIEFIPPATDSRCPTT
jgi:hypothetical protein